jgi:hypothetical protein
MVVINCNQGGNMTKRSKSKSLEPDVVDEIRRLLDSGYSGSEVKRRFGLPYYTITKIKNRSIYGKKMVLQSVATPLQPQHPGVLQSVATTLQPDHFDHAELLQAIATELQQVKDENQKLREQVRNLAPVNNRIDNELDKFKDDIEHEWRSTLRQLKPILDRLE